MLLMIPFSAAVVCGTTQVEREQYISQLISSPRDVVSETFALRWGTMSEVAAAVRRAGEGEGGVGTRALQA
jgi:hypothetical protein